MVDWVNCTLTPAFNLSVLIEWNKWFCADATLSCTKKAKSQLVSYIDWQLEKYPALHPLWGPIHLPNKCANNYIGIYWINYCISERRECSEGIFLNDHNLHGCFTYWIASLFFCLLSAFVVHISREDFYFIWNDTEYQFQPFEKLIGVEFTKGNNWMVSSKPVGREINYSSNTFLPFVVRFHIPFP